LKSKFLFWPKGEHPDEHTGNTDIKIGRKGPSEKSMWNLGTRCLKMY